MGFRVLGDWGPLGALSQELTAGELCLASEPDWILVVQLTTPGTGLTLSVLQLPVCK